MSYEKNLKRITESAGINQTLSALKEGIETKQINPDRISLRRLAHEFMGDNWHETFVRSKNKTLLESSESVDASAFTAITGQLLVNEIRDKYQLAVDISEKLVTEIPVVNGNLSSQKIPYLSDVIDVGDSVNEGMPYPQTQFVGQYITYPAIRKVGKLCVVSAEAIFSDLTSQILDSARSVGTYVGLAKTYEIFKVVLGITNSFSWNGTSYNTYQSSGPWINSIPSGFNLVDYSSINTLEQLFYQMRDPVTGQPINILPKSLLVMPQQKYQARVIVGASEVSKGAFSPTADQIRLGANNPLDSDYEIISSQYALKTLTDAGYTLPQANGRVYLGDFKQAFVWRNCKPLTIVEAPPLNPLDFNQDLVMAVKASWWGTAGIRDPRYVALGVA